MISLLSLLLMGQLAPEPRPSQDVSAPLAELFRLTDDYRQCLNLDKTSAADPRDTYFAEGGTSSENLDLLLSDGQDRLLKHLIKEGRGSEILNALSSVVFTQVDEDQCEHFDPYFGPALDQLRKLEEVVGLPRDLNRKRGRPQRARR